MIHFECFLPCNCMFGVYNQNNSRYANVKLRHSSTSFVNFEIVSFTFRFLLLWIGSCLHWYWTRTFPGLKKRSKLSECQLNHALSLLRLINEDIRVNHCTAHWAKNKPKFNELRIRNLSFTRFKLIERNALIRYW